MNIGHGGAPLDDVDDRGDGGLGHVLQGPLDRRQAERGGAAVVLVSEAEDRQVTGYGQIQVCGGLEDAGGL